MDAFLQQFQHLKIQLEDITSATDNFNDDYCIGSGGFGIVYKGQLSHSKGRSMVAIKRLDRRHGQGIPEFLKEITGLSRYSHENLISLLGFCYQGDEMILVYDYASRGSLDHYLNSPHLTWLQRLKICLDAAEGLSYLHDPRETHQRLIHCDVKSANILLTEQWNGKLADFGLSIMGPANEKQSVIVTMAAGTLGYCDPQYAMTHTLTKESDVYSFGVVLFEVLCGKLCCTCSNGRVERNLVTTWIKSYEEKKLNDIIFKDTAIEPLGQSALETFSDIAYRCLKESREDRPRMAEVVTELATALLYQKWFSLNKKGEYCEMISIAECLGSDAGFDGFPNKDNSRFAVGTYKWYGDDILKTHVKTQFLSPGITYTVNLVFKFQYKRERRCERISLKYRLQGERESSISYLAYEREDGWWACELFPFSCYHRIVDLQILFEGFDNRYYSYILVEGIEFQPLENVEHIDDKQTISDSDADADANWEEKLPADYEDIMKRSKNNLQWTTKEEAYSIIHKGFLISDDETKRGIWFSLDKSGKKCHMLSARAVLLWSWNIKVLLFPESRFGEAIQLGADNTWSDSYIFIKTKVQPQLVSSETTYACYLVYKLPEDQSRFEALVKVEDKVCETGDTIWYIYLTSSQTPVIRPKAGQNTLDPLNWPKFKGLPRQRKDGWIDVKIWEFQAATTVNMNLTLNLCDDKKFTGLIVEGIEFRPI